MSGWWLAWCYIPGTFMVLVTVWFLITMQPAFPMVSPTWRGRASRSLVVVTGGLYGAMWWGVTAAQESGCATQVQQFMITHREGWIVPHFPACGSVYDTALHVMSVSLMGLFLLMVVTVALAVTHPSRVKGSVR